MENTAHPYNAFLRQVVFLGILIFIALVIFKQLNFFVGAFLGAITLYVVLRKLLFRMTDDKHWKRWLAALVLVACMAVLLLGIGYFSVEIIAQQIPDIDTSQIMAWVNKTLDNVSDKLGFQIGLENLVKGSGNVLSGMASGLLNTTYSFGFNVFMMLIILYFMLANARKFEENLLKYQPFKGESLCMVEEELTKMIYSNAVGIPLVMLVQAVVAWFVYWLVGVDNPVFWAFLTALCGLIPMVGTALVSVPLGIYFIAMGQTWQGVILIICGFFVIANADNVFRMMFMKRVANTHPLIIIFGVLMGIPLFGFWGIIFGPLLISGFMLLLKIYYTEYGLFKKVKPVRKEVKEMPKEE